MYLDIDECSVNPEICGDNGQCYNDNSGGYNCYCDPDFYFYSDDYGSGCKGKLSQ